MLDRSLLDSLCHTCIQPRCLSYEFQCQIISCSELRDNIRLQWMHGCASEHLYFFKRHLSHARTARGLRRLLTAGADASFSGRVSMSTAGEGEGQGGCRRLNEMSALRREAALNVKWRKSLLMRLLAGDLGGELRKNYPG